jgi:predicted transposase YbfD/YdcC
MEAPGQVVVPDGAGEVGAIPDLLGTLGLAGAIVAIDAAGCQVGTAAIIRGQRGHYVSAVTGNRPTLHEAVRAISDQACRADLAGVRLDTHATAGDGHGRHEGRSVTVAYDPPGWPDGRPGAVVPVGRERTARGVSASTAHYYLTGYAGPAAELAELIRGHWGVENGLHWVLGIAFREDASRTRDLDAGANLAMPRRVAVSPLKRATAEGSTQPRRLMAAWDDDFLPQVLQGIPADHCA